MASTEAAGGDSTVDEATSVVFVGLSSEATWTVAGVSAGTSAGAALTFLFTMTIVPSGFFTLRSLKSGSGGSLRLGALVTEVDAVLFSSTAEVGGGKATTDILQ